MLSHLLFISDSFGLIVAYFRMLVYLSSIYLYIFQCAILDISLPNGGGKESRTPDLLLARQAL